MNPILVALDVSELSQAENLAESVLEHVGGFKVGLELLMGAGPDAVTRLAGLGLPVLADAKLHDIPNTAKHSARELAARGARWVTAHVAGGSEMIAAAAAGLSEGASGRISGLLGVTILTSLAETDLAPLGIGRTVDAQVRGLAAIAHQAGAEGVICSPHEVSAVKAVAASLVAVTPGIRVEAKGSQDQKRVATPSAALKAGADRLVIGRSITGANDPRAAAAAISKSLRDQGLF